MKRSLPGYVLFLMVALTSTRSAAQSSQPVRFELPNGLRVWVQEERGRPMVLVQTTYKVGSLNDSPGQTGNAHYVEHMAYRATQNISNDDIYGFVDRIGGRWTGGTGQMATTYTETVPSWAFEEALRINAERMSHVVFDSVEFERERTNVLTEANGYVVTTPVQILRNQVLAASFELHPYRQNSATWAQDNAVLTRAQGFAFYKNFYGPNNAILAIVGDIRVEDARRLVEKHFAGLPRAPMTGEITLLEPPQRVEKRVRLTMPDAQSHLEIVYRAPQASHGDYPILAVLDRVLAPRIRTALTTSGAIDVTTAHSPTPYPQLYRITATAPPTADLERMVTAVQTEIDRLGREAVAAAELATARVEPAGGGRGGRGGRGAGGGGGGGAATTNPPRTSSLTQIASALAAREVFPQDITAELRERIRVAQTNVSTTQLQSYVDRWLRVSQRTVGTHVPGPTNYRADWPVGGRDYVGERLVMPLLTTPPEQRPVPAPVPVRALQPLEKLPIDPVRRVLSNGVVVRAARSTGATAAVMARVRFGTAPDVAGKEGLSALVARLIASDRELQALTPTVNTGALANDGHFDIRLNAAPANVATTLATLGRALSVRSFDADRIAAARGPAADGGGGRGGRGGGGGGGGGGIAGEARGRVLGAVAPSWRLNAPAAAASSITPNDVNTFLNRLNGGNITVSVVAPTDAAALITSAATALSGVRGGPRVSILPLPPPPRPPTSVQEERIFVADEPQVTVLAGLPGVPRDHPDRRALELLNYIVGVPFYGGRLGWALTKAGLTYSSSAVSTFGGSTGFITLSTECDSRNTGSTIQAIREIVEGVGAVGVHEWELHQAQSFTLGRMQLYGTRDDSGEDAIAVALLDSETNGDELLDLPAFSRAYLGVTIAQVNAVAKKYYRPELLKLVAIGAVPRGTLETPFPRGTFRALFEP